MKRTISDLLDLDTGEQKKANDILGLPEKTLFDLRRELKSNLLNSSIESNNSAGLACALCYQPVYLIGKKSQEMYFRHGFESGDCPIKTGAKYTYDEIERMKYNGAKESMRHKEIKVAIANVLYRDPQCNNVEVEKTIKTSGLSKEFRRPDISASFADKRLVFEIQLSTTFLDVVISREEFYKDEKVFIMWVFDGFSQDGTRFTEKDIYYANKCNAFVITDESRALSNETGRLHIVCHYKLPYIKKYDIDHSWKNEIITFDDLTFDTESYKVYYFDYDTEIEKLESALEFRWLRESFESFWLSDDKLPAAEEGRLSRDWGYTFIDFDLVEKDTLNDGYLPLELKQVLNALYSLKYRKLIGYAYPSNPWLQLSNLMLTSRCGFAGIYNHALHAYGIADDVARADSRSTYRSKITKIKQGIQRGDKKYQQNTSYRKLFKALFPELFSGK